MLVMEVVPKKRIGIFVIGMPISEAISFIERSRDIQSVELKFNEEEPLTVDIVLDLVENGLLLRFDASMQTLKTIEIYDISKVRLLYAGSVFCDFDNPPTLVNIQERFGPTHPGDYDDINHIYCLHYPGLSFAFSIPLKYESLYTNKNKAADEILPMEFPDGTTPVTTRIYLYSGQNLRSMEAPVPSNPTYFQEVLIDLSKGIEFLGFGFPCSLTFNSSTQDILNLLGTPDRVFEKEEDKMKIHSSSYSGLGCADYFYNYFSLGIDVLFDINTHIVKKFILHSNFPCHYEFNIYNKCNFKINLQIKEGKWVTPDTKWSEISKWIGSPQKPVVYNRASNINPFGPTLFYGHQNLIFEVIQNGHLASVCLFSPQAREDF